MRRSDPKGVIRPRCRPNRIGDNRASRLEVIRKWAGKCRRAEDGTSAVEFALFAPVLVFSLLAAVDIGLAEYERMTIDHSLRAAAQSAMTDPGANAVLKVLETTASKNFTLSDGPTASPGALTVAVNRFCACPNNPSVAVACSTTCTESAPTFIYYRLLGTKIHNAMILPAMTLSPSLQVQVR